MELKMCYLRCLWGQVKADENSAGCYSLIRGVWGSKWAAEVSCTKEKGVWGVRQTVKPAHWAKSCLGYATCYQNVWSINYVTEGSACFSLDFSKGKYLLELWLTWFGCLSAKKQSNRVKCSSYSVYFRRALNSLEYLRWVPSLRSNTWLFSCVFLKLSSWSYLILYL